MADIKQAVRWMKEGKKVIRRDSIDGCAFAISRHSTRIVFRDEHTAILFAEDLLADDWEIEHDQIENVKSVTTP